MVYKSELVKIDQKVLLIDFKKIEDIIFKHTLKSYLKDTTYSKINEVWQKLDGSILPESDKSLLSLITYLFYIEGIYTLRIDVIIYYLIKTQCHDIFDDYKREFITKFDDLANVNLATKLKFLKLHKWDEVVNICNKELRNAIAHHNFTILDDGRIEYIKQNGKKDYIDNLELRRRICDIDVLSAFLKIKRSEAMRKKV